MWRERDRDRERQRQREAERAILTIKTTFLMTLSDAQTQWCELLVSVVTRPPRDYLYWLLRRLELCSTRNTDLMQHHFLKTVFLLKDLFNLQRHQTNKMTWKIFLWCWLEIFYNNVGYMLYVCIMIFDNLSTWSTLKLS